MGNKNLTLLEADENKKSKRFIFPSEDDSDDEDGLLDLMEDAKDFQLNHGQDIAHRLTLGRQGLEEERLTKKRKLQNTARADIRFKLTSTTNNNVDNSTTNNFHFNINNTGATITNIGQMGLIPSMNFNQQQPQFGSMFTNQSLQHGQLFDSVETLIQRHKITHPGIQGNLWLKRYLYAYDFFRSGNSLRGGYNSTVDVKCSEWINRQRRKLLSLDVIKQQLLAHIQIGI